MAYTKASKYTWLLVVFNSAATIAETCYAPPLSGTENGTAQSDVYTSCNVGQAVSMCCRTQTLVSGEPGNVCLSSGLCSKLETNGTKSYFREACTDPTWESPFCIQVPCSQDSSSNAEVTPCPNNGTFYCCGGGNTDCCGTSSAFSIAAVDDPSSSTTSSAATSSSTATSSTTTSSSTTSSSAATSTSTATSSSAATSTSAGTSLSAQSNSTSGSGLSTAAKAGIGIGVAVVAIAALAALGLYILRRKRVEANDAMNPMLDLDYTKGKDGVSELHSSSRPSEVPATNEEVYSELNGVNYR